MDREHRMRDGMRAAVPLLLPSLALGVSFGVLAAPVLGSFPAILMSVIVNAGGAQVAATTVLQAGGSAAAAITAGLLMNARFLPMSFAMAPWLRGRPVRRAIEAQAIVDPSFVMARAGYGRFDPNLLIGATVAQLPSWMGGTGLGVALGPSLPAPGTLGLDAIFPAFYLTLLAGELRDRRAVGVIVLAAAVTLVLIPITPAGVPVIAASVAALLGLRRA